MPFAISCTNEQKVLVHVAPASDAGTPEKLDGAIKVAVTSGDGTAEVQPDGLSFFAISGSNPGDTTYVVSGDADLGAGDVEISDVVTLTVSGALASHFGITADAPVVK